MSDVRKAIFPVAGLGTRFLPATKALPKEMLPVVDKPLIEYAVDEARRSGITDLVFVTGRGKTAIEDHFDNHYELEATLQARGRSDLLDVISAGIPEPGQVAYVRQMEPLGLGHAVWCARHLVNNEPFAVLLADELIQGARPSLLDLIETRQRHGGSVVGVMAVPPEQTSRYGIVSPVRQDGRIIEVNDLVEKPAPAESPSNLAIVGRYVLSPSILRHLENAAAGAGGEIQLTDAMRSLAREEPFHAVLVEGRRVDCGTKVGFLEANVAVALQRADELDGDVRGTLKALLEGE